MWTDTAVSPHGGETRVLDGRRGLAAPVVRGLFLAASFSILTGAVVGGARAQVPGAMDDARAALSALRRAAPAEQDRLWGDRPSLDGLVGLELVRVERALGASASCAGRRISTPCEYGGAYDDWLAPCSSDDQLFYVAFAGDGMVRGMLLDVAAGIVVGARWTVWPGIA